MVFKLDSFSFSYTYHTIVVVFLVLGIIIGQINCSDFLIDLINYRNAPQITEERPATVGVAITGEADRPDPGYPINTNTLHSNSAEKAGEQGKDIEKDLFSVHLRVLEIPGESFIRVYGKKVNGRDSLGNISPRVEFLGVPFAHPPVDSLRFQRPTMKILTEDFKALEEPEECPQLSTNGRRIGVEDCLYLNIYVPQMQQEIGKAKLPVLLWFHGESLERSADGKFGVFTSGSAKDLSPDIFMQNRIVVVTPQYRLGSLGFMSTVNEDLNGNMGIFDQVLALEWIQRFIEYFGGDPKQVTVQGHGSSAISLGLLSTSDLARGLYHRMILMAGSAVSSVAIDPTPKQTFAEIALQNSCPSFPTLRFVRCMQHRDVDSIIEADDRLSKGKHLGKSRTPLPIIQRSADGRFLPPVVYLNPMTAISGGNFDAVPIILGVSSSEMGGFLPNIAGKQAQEIPTAIFSGTNVLKQFIRAIVSRGTYEPELLSDLVTFEYFGGLNVTQRQDQAKDIIEEFLSDYIYHMPAIQLAKAWSRYAPVYFYVFDYVPTGSENTKNGDEIVPGEDLFPEAFQATHGSDLRFLMKGHKGSAHDREISTALIDFWANFIHKGSPLHAGIDWPQFREDSKDYLYIGNDIGPSVDFRKRQDLFWNGLIEEVNKRACKASTSSTGRGSNSRNRQPSIFRDTSFSDIDLPSSNKGYFYLGNFSIENIDDPFNF